MILKRQIVLKAVVTEALKEQLITDIQSAIQRVEASHEELDRQSRRMMLELQRTDLNRAMSFRQQLDAEKRKYEDARAELLEQREEVQQLELGQEVVRTTLEGTVEVQLGDNIGELLGGAEIVVIDDVVTEIRDPARG